MSMALEILGQRKQAGLFGRAAMPSGVADSDYARTNWLREHKGSNPPAPPRPAEGFTLPARMAPQPFPQHVLDTHQRSQAQTAQVQSLVKRTQGGGQPAPEPSQADRDAQHASMVSSLKKVEASRLAPKLPMAPDPNWPPKAAPAATPAAARQSTGLLSKLIPRFGAKVACFDCPALEVLRLRAAT